MFIKNHIFHLVVYIVIYCQLFSMLQLQIQVKPSIIKYIQKLCVAKNSELFLNSKNWPNLHDHPNLVFTCQKLWCYVVNSLCHEVLSLTKPLVVPTSPSSLWFSPLPVKWVCTRLDNQHVFVTNSNNCPTLLYTLTWSLQ
jgi:hypothetical protein